MSVFKSREDSLFALVDYHSDDENEDKLDAAEKMCLQARIEEFEKVSRYFETNLLMHRLAATHFQARAKWFSFLPILMLTTTVSILGFISTAITEKAEVLDAVFDEVLDETLEETIANITDCRRFLQFDDDGGDTRGNREFLRDAAFWSGIMGVVSTFWASLSKYNNYQSKADMHLSAVNTLASICDSIRINEILLGRAKYNMAYTSMKQKKLKERKRNSSGHSRDDNMSVDSEDEIGPNEIGGIKFGGSDEVVECDIESHKTAFKTMKESCTFPIPTYIEKGFRDLYWEFRPAPPKVRKHIYPRMYYALWDRISDVWYFPLILPNIDIKAFIREQMADDYEFFLEMKHDVRKKRYNNSEPLDKTAEYEE